MSIRERIFERLKQLSMSQKEFSERTGIQQSTISEWKKKKTNPSSEKIMPICEALGVTPEWLLLGISPSDVDQSESDYILVKKDAQIAHLLAYYRALKPDQRERVMGYTEAFVAQNENEDRKPKKP